MRPRLRPFREALSTLRGARRGGPLSSVQPMPPRRERLTPSWEQLQAFWISLSSCRDQYVLCFSHFPGAGPVNSCCCHFRSIFEHLMISPEKLGDRGKQTSEFQTGWWLSLEWLWSWACVYPLFMRLHSSLQLGPAPHGLVWVMNDIWSRVTNCEIKHLYGVLYIWHPLSSSQKFWFWNIPWCTV